MDVDTGWPFQVVARTRFRSGDELCTREERFTATRVAGSGATAAP